MKQMLSTLAWLRIHPEVYLPVLTGIMNMVSKGDGRLAKTMKAIFPDPKKLLEIWLPRPTSATTTPLNSTLPPQAPESSAKPQDPPPAGQ